MAAQATILNDIVSNAARAADSAAEAARALREAADRPKVVKCPEFFCDVTGDERSETIGVILHFHSKLG